MAKEKIQFHSLSEQDINKNLANAIASIGQAREAESHAIAVNRL
jgi:predicted transcriptional regulator